MLHASRSLLLTLFLPALAVAGKSDPVPEVQRPPGGTPQPVGQLHTLRNIPEACVRLEGQFTGDAATPYRFNATRHERCAQRAIYADAAGMAHPPSMSTGWILNDRISVARADKPDCIATLEIWRKPGDTAPPALDAQGRSRIYLDKPLQPVAAPLFTATLRPPAGCG